MHRRDEAGESLVEILIAIVIMGLVMGAIFATYSTTATSTKSQRDFVTADAELRDYAEAAKAAAKSCPTTPLTLAAPATPYPYPVTGSGLACPAVTSVQPVDITVTLPNGSTRTLSIDLRTP